MEKDPKESWADSQSRQDMNEKWHHFFQSKGYEDHKGPTASTCPACFAVDPQTVEHSYESDREAARGHLTSQQFDKMFGHL
jgi:hypothetical protein